MPTGLAPPPELHILSLCFGQQVVDPLVLQMRKSGSSHSSPKLKNWAFPDPVFAINTERVGFEPTEAFTSNDFESFAFDHSATSPWFRTSEHHQLSEPRSPVNCHLLWVDAALLRFIPLTHTAFAFIGISSRALGDLPSQIPSS